MVVILPEMDEKSATIIADKLRQSVESHGFISSGGKTIHVTASFGISSMNMVGGFTGKEAEQLVKLADDALYAAKGNGRNRVVLAHWDE